MSESPGEGLTALSSRLSLLFPGPAAAFRYVSAESKGVNRAVGLWDVGSVCGVPAPGLVASTGFVAFPSSRLPEVNAL